MYSFEYLIFIFMKKKDNIIYYIPDGYKFEKVENNTMVVLSKDVEITSYKDFSKILESRYDKSYYIDDWSVIQSASNSDFSYANAAITQAQLEKLLALNMLINVALYLNDGWVPNWNDSTQPKYIIFADENNNIKYTNYQHVNHNTGIIAFKNAETVKDAITILGKETLLNALRN